VEVDDGQREPSLVFPSQSESSSWPATFFVDTVLELFLEETEGDHCLPIIGNNVPRFVTPYHLSLPLKKLQAANEMLFIVSSVYYAGKSLLVSTTASTRVLKHVWRVPENGFTFLSFGRHPPGARGQRGIDPLLI
jgi:hypothetical protein